MARAVCGAVCSSSEEPSMGTGLPRRWGGGVVCALNSKLRLKTLLTLLVHQGVGEVDVCYFENHPLSNKSEANCWIFLQSEYC